MKKNKIFFKKVLTNLFSSVIIITEGNRNPKKPKGMVLDMLDVENFKTMLQCEVNHREEAKAAWEHYRTSNDSYLVTVYEKMYIKYRSRYNAMCDILFAMGYLVFVNDDNAVRVEKRSNLDNISDDEIPF